MINLNEITFAEKVFFEIQRLKRELEILEDFVAAQLNGQQSDKPKIAQMIDPRSGEAFKKSGPRHGGAHNHDL